MGGFVIILGVAFILGFVSTKVVGYYAAGRYLRREVPELPTTPIRIAAARVILGVCVDIVVFGVANKASIPRRGDWPFVIAYVALIGLRAVEWRIIIAAAAGRGLTPPAIKARLGDYVVLGTIWSSLLDLVGLVATVAACVAFVRLG